MNRVLYYCNKLNLGIDCNLEQIGGCAYFDTPSLDSSLRQDLQHWSVAHATRHAQRGTNRRQNRYQNLNQRLPCLFLHSFFRLVISF